MIFRSLKAVTVSIGVLVYCEGHTDRYSLSFSMMAGILSVGISITVLKGFMGTSVNDHLPLKQESASSWTV